jgi:hypothetical protein
MPRAWRKFFEVCGWAGKREKLGPVQVDWKSDTLKSYDGETIKIIK